MIDTNHGKKQLIYFDHGASTHAPTPVIDAYLKVHREYYSNVHRGRHALSCIATDTLDKVPVKIAKYLGVNDMENSGMHSVQTYNTTSSLDLASHVFGKIKGDTLTTVLEHHSNDLPHRSRGKVHHAGILDDGTLDLDDVEEKLQKNNIKLFAVTAASNVTGYMPPLAKLARMAHDNGAKFLVDGAQRIAHYNIKVNEIDHPEHIDFFAAAGHKMYSPFGSAFLFGNTEEFDNALPYIPGGGTVKLVTTEEAIYVTGQDRHAYGTPNIAGAIALGEALDFLSNIGINNIEKHERELSEKVEKGLRGIDGVNVLGNIPLDEKIGVISFNMDNIYHEDLSQLLNDESAIATRNGCFCAHPYTIELMKVPQDVRDNMKREVEAGHDPKMPGAVRVTIGLYNTAEEIDELLRVVEKMSDKQL